MSERSRNEERLGVRDITVYTAFDTRTTGNWPRRQPAMTGCSEHESVLYDRFRWQTHVQEAASSHLITERQQETSPRLQGAGILSYARFTHQDLGLSS